MFRRITFQSIPVSDQQRALEFYRDTLGFDVQTDLPYEADTRWIFMQIPGAETLLHLSLQDRNKEEHGPALCLVADDVDAEAERLRSNGVTLIEEPTDAPWNDHVRYSLFEDSEGNCVMMQSSTLEP